MTLRESALFGIVSGMITFSLSTTWIGYERGSYEMNPIARRIFETIYQYTGSWAAGILTFIPLCLIGIYIAAKYVDQDLNKAYGFPHGVRLVLWSFFLIQLPSSLHQSHLIKLPSNRITFLWSYGSALLYVIAELLLWRKHKKVGSGS